MYLFNLSLPEPQIKELDFFFMIQLHFHFSAQESITLFLYYVNGIRPCLWGDLVFTHVHYSSISGPLLSCRSSYRGEEFTRDLALVLHSPNLLGIFLTSRNKHIHD